MFAGLLRDGDSPLSAPSQPVHDDDWNHQHLIWDSIPPVVVAVFVQGGSRPNGTRLSGTCRFHQLSSFLIKRLLNKMLQDSADFPIFAANFQIPHLTALTP